MKSFGPKKFSNFIQGLKSAYLAIFQKSALFVSAALKTSSVIWLFWYETVVISSTSSFVDSDPDPSSVSYIARRNYISLSYEAIKYKEVSVRRFWIPKRPQFCEFDSQRGRNKWFEAHSTVGKLNLLNWAWSPVLSNWHLLIFYSIIYYSPLIVCVSGRLFTDQNRTRPFFLYHAQQFGNNLKRKKNQSY